MRKRVANSYTPEGRKEIHKALGLGIDTEIMRYLMFQTVPRSTMTSLYCAQFGKCAVTGEKLEIGSMHCHHKLPKYLGGTDEYKNLVFVSESVHRLIHATNPGTIRSYLEKLKLTPKQLKKLDKLRSLAHVESCLKYPQSKTLMAGRMNRNDSCPALGGGKSGDNIKGLPIATSSRGLYPHERPDCPGASRNLTIGANFSKPDIPFLRVVRLSFQFGGDDDLSGKNRVIIGSDSNCHENLSV